MMRVRRTPGAPRALGTPPDPEQFWWNVFSSIMGGLIVAGAFYAFDWRYPKEAPPT